MRWFNPLRLILVVGLLFEWLWLLAKWAVIGPFVVTTWLVKR